MGRTEPYRYPGPTYGREMVYPGHYDPSAGPYATPPFLSYVPQGGPPPGAPPGNFPTPEVHPAMPPWALDDCTINLCAKCMPKKWLGSHWFCPSHIADWLMLVVVAVWIALWFAVPNPPERPYTPSADIARFSDNVYTFPIKDDTIPVWLSPILGIGIPLIVFVLFYFFGGRSGHDLHHAILGVLASEALQYAVQIPCTIIFGKFRPDFAARLAHGDAAEIRNGRLSFFSGHTSSGFAGLGFLSLYLAGKTRAMIGGHVWRVVVCFLPQIISIWQGATRWEDNKHHPSDIFAAAVVGLLFSYLCYYMFYPSLTSPYCGQPKNRKLPLFEQLGPRPNPDPTPSGRPYYGIGRILFILTMLLTVAGAIFFLVWAATEGI